MASRSISGPLQNINMEVTPEREEGEMSDESMSIDGEPQPLFRKPIIVDDDHKIIYKVEMQGLIVEKLDRVDFIEIQERAKTFGINLTGNNVISQKQIDDLYENVCVDGTNERHIQFNTIHLKGVNGLTTRDIFDYLKDYNPVAVERINESSCNVLCKDHISAALAILVSSRDIVDEKVKAITSRNSRHYWRQGLPHPYSDLILMRFATNCDAPVPIVKDSKKWSLSTNESAGKNPWGDLCQTWGIYDHQEVYGPKLPPKSYIKTEGLLKKDARYSEQKDIAHFCIKNTKLAKRLGKRQYRKESIDDESNSDDEWEKKSKAPRMRMRADDEEQKIKLQHHTPHSEQIEEDHPSLSIQIDNTNNENSALNSVRTPLSQKFSKRIKGHLESNRLTDIHSRLGERIISTSEGESSDDSSMSYRETNLMSRVQKAPVTKEHIKLTSVWTRLEKRGNPTDLRQNLNNTKISTSQSNQSDLRTKLKENKRSPLRIEIDNEYYESD